MKRFRTALPALLSLLALPAHAQEHDLVALGAAVDGLGVAARVLVIAAHPDDEDTQLITWLARGRQVEAAYLSLTRGDGGQNLIGNELGEALGVIRTEELLAARRIDGGVQYFSRAFDFGYSKSAQETFRHWPRDSILRDVVTVVRSFRPHVIVSVFSGTPRDGHGHHQAAGMLAREAYDLAGDTLRMPRGINAEGLDPWTPLKFYRGARFRPAESTLRFNVGEFDPLRGRSYAELAAISRSQHRSQGFGAMQRRGVVMNQVRREHSRVPAPADPHAERSIFDGIDTTLIGQLGARGASSAYRPGLDELSDAIIAARAVPLRQRESLVARLAALRALIEPAGTELSRLLDERSGRALAIASGVVMEAEVDRGLVATGERVPLRVRLYNRGGSPLRVAPPQIFSCRPADRTAEAASGRWPVARDSAVVLQPDSARTWEGVLCAPAQPSGPWWLSEPRDGSMFRVATVAAPEGLINRGPTLRAEVSLADAAGAAGPPFGVEEPVVHRFVDPVRGDVRRPVAFVPPVSVLLDRTVEYAPAGRPLDRQVRVQLRSAASADQTVRARILLPDGLEVDSAERTIELPAGATRQVVFRLTGQLPPGRDSIRVAAESGDGRFTLGYVPIEYEHIRPQRVYRPASITVEAVDVRVPPGLTVGYLAGVADNIAPMLEQLGIALTQIDPAELGTVDLSRFRTVVVGPRAYQSFPELAEHSSRLLEYVEAGGTLLVQYGQYELMREGITPYPFTIGRPHDRVTDEAAPVRILDPEHPLLRAPNHIAAADFEGWVQERALYMPATWDDAYTPLLEMADPGEEPHRGAILVAPYGRGTYVFTSLAFFRQLPAGVPGAARLFVNLLSAGE